MRTLAAHFAGRSYERLSRAQTAAVSGGSSLLSKTIVDLSS